MNWAILIAVVLAALGALATMGKDPSYSPRIRRFSYLVLAVFVAYLVFGIFVATALPVEVASDVTRGFLILTLVIYLAYGALWILRLTPSRRPPPKWVLKPWTRLDAVMIAVFLIGVAGTVWGLVTTP